MGREQGRRALRGWGFVEQAATAAEREQIAAVLAARFPDHASARGADRFPAPADDGVPALRTPRLRPPAALAAWCATDDRTRALHALGRSYADVVRAARGELPYPPDVVAHPRDAADVAAVLDWCADAGAVCVPFGGGTSVVGGVEARGVDAPVVALQTRAMDRVVEVDRVSRAAHVQAGATGPVIEQQLRASGLTLRFFPQSFELSTLGGWVATRAAGHYATGPVHIEDLVQAVSAVTPRGTWSSRRLPGSGAGPSPDRLLAGSEGTLGVLTDVWVRLQDRPLHRASATVRFPAFTDGAAAVRALAQSGLQPAGCRLLDPLEALLGGVGDGSAAVLVLGLESAHVPVDADAAVALALCADHGGTCPEGVRPGRADGGADGGAGGGSGAWNRSFVRAPYLRDVLIACGMVVETFETAFVWQDFDVRLEAVLAATREAVAAVLGDGLVTVRLTHAYPDGAAPYVTVIAPGRAGAELAQWAEVKAAASEALLAAGGTITHHHAVGRDHRPWYDRQRPEVFAAALRAAKQAVDPGGLLNPGVLVDPLPPGQGR